MPDNHDASCITIRDDKAACSFVRLSACTKLTLRGITPPSKKHRPDAKKNNETAGTKTNREISTDHTHTKKKKLEMQTESVL